MKNINLPVLPQSRTSQRTTGLDGGGILATNDYDEQQNQGSLSDNRKSNPGGKNQDASNDPRLQSYRSSLKNNDNPADLNQKIAENIKREEIAAIDIYDSNLTMKEIKTIKSQ